jgi:hypothetical protein
MVKLLWKLTLIGIAMVLCLAGEGFPGTLLMAEACNDDED